MPRKIKRYGWVPDHPDHRDLTFSLSGRTARLPAAIDLRSKMPAIFDQGDLGSCTANSACALVWYTALKEGHPSVQPSRLFQYYNSRVLEGTVGSDSGATIRDSVKAMAKWGFCPEDDCPYDISRFAKKPSAKAYKDAVKEIVKVYHSVPQDALHIKTALSEGLPVDFGFTVYESFESDTVAKTGIVPMPGRNESVLGGHAVLLVGYDDAHGRYIARNSWGTTWGVDGYFFMPYAYVHYRGLSSDFWVINVVP